MPGVELESSEFAYLLETLHADSVIGLEAPELFPTKQKDQEKVFNAGWDRLLANGWAKPLEDDAFDLDSLLLEMVAVVAAPEFVVATTSNAGARGERELLLHYQGGDRLVEFAVIEDDRYALGILSDFQELGQRCAELMALEPSDKEIEFTLPASTFEKLQSASAEGAGKKISTLLDKTDLNGDLRESFEGALTGATRGQILLLQTRSGEVEHGRRAHVYGKGSSAWIAYLPSAEAEEVIIRNCQPASLEAWISSGLEELQG